MLTFEVCGKDCGYLLLYMVGNALRIVRPLQTPEKMKKSPRNVSQEKGLRVSSNPIHRNSMLEPMK